MNLSLCLRFKESCQLRFSPSLELCVLSRALNAFIFHSASQVYKILLQVTPLVQPVSVDEAFLDVTGLGDPEELASAIRDKIFKATGCTASAGISHNMLLARLATKTAKPNGQYLLPKSQVITEIT